MMIHSPVLTDDTLRMLPPFRRRSRPPRPARRIRRILRRGPTIVTPLTKPITPTETKVLWGILFSEVGMIAFLCTLFYRL